MFTRTCWRCWGCTSDRTWSDGSIWRCRAIYRTRRSLEGGFSARTSGSRDVWSWYPTITASTIIFIDRNSCCPSTSTRRSFRPEERTGMSCCSTRGSSLEETSRTSPRIQLETFISSLSCRPEIKPTALASRSIPRIFCLIWIIWTQSELLASRQKVTRWRALSRPGAR